MDRDPCLSGELWPPRFRPSFRGGDHLSWLLLPRPLPLPFSGWTRATTPVSTMPTATLPRWAWQTLAWWWAASRVTLSSPPCGMPPSGLLLRVWLPALQEGPHQGGALHMTWRVCECGGEGGRDKPRWFLNTSGAALASGQHQAREDGVPLNLPPSLPGSGPGAPRVLAAKLKGCLWGWGVWEDPCPPKVHCTPGMSSQQRPSHPSPVEEGLGPWTPLTRLSLPVSVPPHFCPKAAEGKGGLGPLGGCQSGEERVWALATLVGSDGSHELGWTVRVLGLILRGHPRLLPSKPLAHVSLRCFTPGQLCLAGSRSP